MVSPASVDTVVAVAVDSVPFAALKVFSERLSADETGLLVSAEEATEVAGTFLVVGSGDVIEISLTRPGVRLTGKVARVHELQDLLTVRVTGLVIMTVEPAESVVQVSLTMIVARVSTVTVDTGVL